jgi:hypothetical protein
MADMTTLEVEADVSESSLSKVRIGQPVEIQLDALPDKRFRGEVSRTVPTVDRSKATVMTKIRFLDPDPGFAGNECWRFPVAESATPSVRRPAVNGGDRSGRARRRVRGADKPPKCRSRPARRSATWWKSGAVRNRAKRWCSGRLKNCTMALQSSRRSGR